MSWLRSSPLRQSLTRTNSSSGQASKRTIDSATDCDPRACYDSFCKHWQQAYDIILRAEPKKPPTHDDVLGVVSHLDHMVTLILVELHNCNKISLPTPNQTPPAAPCLEFLLSENLLDKLYEWGKLTGRYANAVRLEQLKLYELLVSHSRHQLLCHEPFLRPLLKILASSQGEIFPPDVEKRLVILLNQLCVVLMQNVHLLDLFFFSSNQHGNGQNSANFIIFSLLIPYVHREGSIGHQARDALLLCMALSQKNSNVGTYIAQYSSMCPLLVTGLGGLFSRLPSTLEINSIDWHRITPDDVTEIPELTLFMNSLEFCNAVVQVAHTLIKQQLLDFMYQGFIVPVLGPSILQIFKGKQFQTNIESQISAIAYLDLILRSVTEPGLLRAFVKFLLDEEKFDGQRILDVLIDRLNTSDPNLSMVTISFFDTLMGLYCEDIILELILKFLLPGKHIPISYRHKINNIDPYINSVNFFLDLTPDVMKHSINYKKLRKSESTVVPSTNNMQTVQLQQHRATIGMPIQPPQVSKTIGANWNHYALHSSGDNNSLYSNYNAYLFDAHYKIGLCRAACSKWANSYKYQKWPPRGSGQQTIERLTEMVKNFMAEFSISGTTAIITNNNEAQIFECDKNNKYDSLQSIGESSGYESFKWRPDEEMDNSSNNTNNNGGNTQINSNLSDLGDCNRENQKRPGKSLEPPVWRLSVRKDISILDLDFSEDLFTQGTVSLGPFLNALWRKLQTFASNSFYVNIQLTGLITRLAWFPLPLIHSLLLRPDIVITSDTPSFHQILRILKQQIDAELPSTEDSMEIIDVARSLLIDREFRLMNSRKNTMETSKNPSKNGIAYNNQTTTFANISATTPPQLTPSSSYDPFKRNDNKRKSFSKSFTSIFSRKSNGSPFSLNNNSTLNPSTSSSSNNSLASNTSTTSFTTHHFSSNNHHAASSTSTPPSSLNSIPLRDTISTTPTTTLSTRSDSQSTLNSLSTMIGNSSVGGSVGNSEPNSLDSLQSTMGSLTNTDRNKDLALCAVLLDEWLKELAAISQEQSIVLLSEQL